MRLLKLVLALCTAMWFAAPALAASVDGLAIRSTVQGTGPTIIFVHGWTCDESSWDSQVPAFMHDYRVVTLDLPGHGKSDSPAQAAFSMDLFAAAVEAVRKEIGADRIVLVGHSMGAGVIRKYALNYPQHVAGLVAVDGEMDVRLFAAHVDRPPMTLARRAEVVETMFVPATPEALREKIRAMMLTPPEATAIGAAAAMVSPAIQSTRLITAPAMTIWAGNRVLEQYKSTKQMLPNWQDVQMPGTGHFLMMEQPEKFNAFLRKFLKERAKF